MRRAGSRATSKPLAYQLPFCGYSGPLSTDLISGCRPGGAVMNAGRMTRELHGEVERLLGHQAGVITRAQALAGGMTRDATYARLRTARRPPIHARAYAASRRPV